MSHLTFCLSNKHQVDHVILLLVFKCDGFVNCTSYWESLLVVLDYCCYFNCVDDCLTNGSVPLVLQKEIL